MKKKILLLLLCACSLVGCSSKKEPTPEVSQDIQIPEPYTESIEQTEEYFTEEQSTVTVETTTQENSTDNSIDFSFSFIGNDPTTITKSEETLVSMYVEDVLITMPLTYSDLERQGLSIDYQVTTAVDTPVSRAYGIDDSDANWLTISDISGTSLVNVFDEHVLLGSHVITSDTKIGIITPSSVFAKVSYFGLEKDKSTYDEVNARMKELGFNSVKYISMGMNEYIVGCINLNGNNCEVWMEISIFEEEGVLKDIYIINQSVLGNSISSEYEFRTIPYGESASSGDSNTVIDDSIMDYTLGGKTYSYDSTLVDYIKNGWKLMAITPSESGGEITLLLKKNGCKIQFVTTTMYIKTTGKHHEISEDTVPSYIILDSNCMSIVDFMGVGGVCSYGEFEDSDAFDFIDSSSGSSSDSIVCDMQGYGVVTFGLLDNYINNMKIQYER